MDRTVDAVALERGGFRTAGCRLPPLRRVKPAPLPAVLRRDDALHLRTYALALPEGPRSAPSGDVTFVLDPEPGGRVEEAELRRALAALEPAGAADARAERDFASQLALFERLQANDVFERAVEMYRSTALAAPVESPFAWDI